MAMTGNYTYAPAQVETEEVLGIDTIRKLVSEMVVEHGSGEKWEVKVYEELMGIQIDLYTKINDRVLGIRRKMNVPITSTLLRYSVSYMLETIKEEKPYLHLKEKVYKHFKGSEADEMYYMFKKRDIEFKLKQKREAIWQRSSLLQKQM